MTKTLGMMSNIEKEELVSIWSKILSIQTRFFGSEEVKVLSVWGFGDTEKGVLDVGCGTGDYGLFLAKQFPHTQFYGIERNDKFIEEFNCKNEELCASNYSIAKCDIDSDIFPQEMTNKFDQVILRLVLQHISNPISILQYLYQELPRNGRIYVVEEDDGFFKIHPDCKAFYQVVNIWKMVGNHFGTARCIGREIPELLTKSGFNVKKVKAVLHNNYEVGSKLMEYLVATVKLCQVTSPNLISPNEPERIEKEFEKYLDQYGDSWFAVYPEIITMGEKR